MHACEQRRGCDCASGDSLGVVVAIRVGRSGVISRDERGMQVRAGRSAGMGVRFHLGASSTV